MIERPESNDPLRQWVDSHVSGTLSDEDRLLLEARLDTDPAAREFYLEYCELHCDLLLGRDRTKVPGLSGDALRLSRELYLKCCDLQGAVRCDPENAGIAGENVSGADTLGHSQLLPDRYPPRPREGFDWKLAMALTVAASALLVAALSVSSRRQEHLARPNARANPLPSYPGLPAESFDVRPTVAMVTGLQNCAWDHVPYKTGEGVSAGATLEITTGQAKLAYENGVELVLQSPCRVTTVSSHLCKVHAGTVSLSVPDSVNGFSVQTDVADIADLGATYGVHVDDDGGAELHVFEGEAVLWQLNGNRRETHVVAGKSVAVSSQMVLSSLRKAQPARFARQLLPNYSEDDFPELPIQTDLALWLAGDMNVSTDEQGRVVSWHDILTGGNKTNEDAWQNKERHRPTLIPHAIGGMPAVRFDGKSSYLETAPLLTTEDQTLFFVFSRASDVDKPSSNTDSLYKSRQLINYNGPVHRIDGGRHNSAARKHALQVCDRLESGRYWGRVWAVRGDGQNSVHLGSVKARTKLPIGQPAILCYCYHPSHNVAALYFNGTLQGVDTAPIGREYTSRKVIGRSCMYPAFFDGDIAELLIYNGAVNHESLDSIHTYLSGRYGIQVTSIESSPESPIATQADQ